LNDKSEKDRTQFHEWGRHLLNYVVAAAIAAYAISGLRVEKENREIRRELQGDLTAKFEVINTLVSQQNREVTGIIAFNNDSLSSVEVSKIVLHAYRVIPIKDLKDRLIADDEFQKLSSEYTNASYQLANTANNGDAESKTSLEKLQSQLVQLETRLSNADTRQTKVFFIGRCAPDLTKYEKLQTIDLGESFFIGSKSTHGYSFRMVEARPLVDGTVTEWIKYDIVIDYVTEQGDKKQVAASVFSGDLSEGMPEVMCYPTGM